MSTKQQTSKPPRSSREEIQRLRERKGVSIRALAGMVNVHYNTLFIWLGGGNKDGKHDVLSATADACKVALRALPDAPKKKKAKPDFHSHAT